MEEGGLIEIILTVCAIANPANCEEKYLQFAWDGSLRQCMMAAQPYIAEWIGQHPAWMRHEMELRLSLAARSVRFDLATPGACGKRCAFAPLGRAPDVVDVQFGPKATPQGSSPT
jgi:hypothetical protein